MGGPVSAAGPHARSKKRYFQGTHRIVSPAETWSRVSPHFGRIGITRVADITRLDRVGIPVYQSVRPASRNLSVSQGKGLTPEAARVSAAMESVEMWHAECLDHVTSVSATLQEMRHGNPIPAEALRWMAGSRRLESFPIQWVQAASLSRGRAGWLPRDMLELDFTSPRLFAPQMFVRNSNGLASGNDRSEALLHGLCELIERHAWYLAQVEPDRLCSLDPDTLDGEGLLGVLAAIRSAGLKLALFDISWDVGVPVAFAKLVSPDLPVVWHGSGAHPSPEVALSRALTEAAQSRLTYIAGARDDLVGLAKEAVMHRAFDAFGEPCPERSFEAMPSLASGDVGEDLEAVVGRLAAAGYEPYWVDLTRPEVGIPVVSTFVPGLREMHG